MIEVLNSAEFLTGCVVGAVAVAVLAIVAVIKAFNDMNW